MKILIVGGGGHLGRIITPTLEAHHDCYHFDLKPVVGSEARTTIANVSDDAAVKKAIVGQNFDCVLYLPLAQSKNGQHVGGDINPNFDVHVRDCFRFFQTALAAGVRRLIYASSLSVYTQLWRKDHITDENTPSDEWHPYGLSKRLGEAVCIAAGQAYPSATIIALRMIMPRSDEQWQTMQNENDKYLAIFQGPNDTRALYLAAVDCNVPGVHIIQTTGDVTNKSMPNTRATALLNWAPRGN